MRPLDEEKTAFITPTANYYYKVTPFGLMNKIFVEHIKTLMEVYINDMLVKTSEEEDLLSNMEIVFGCLHKHKMKLNAKKCVFSVEAEKFLGFMLTHRGIEANPDKMSSNIRYEKSDIREGCSMLDEKDSLLLKIFSSISLESIAFLYIIEEGEQL